MQTLPNATIAGPQRAVAFLDCTGYVTVPYPLDLRAAVSEALGAWLNFTALPDAAKSKFPYGHNGTGVGYQRKDGSGPAGDRKENFDVAPAHREWLEEQASDVGPRAMELARASLELVDRIKPIVTDFAREVEREYRLEGFGDEVAANDGDYFVRFIRYPGGRTRGDEIATAHIDQGGFTLHLFESAPGFQILGYDHAWCHASFDGKETLIIPSMQLQLRSGGKLKATCHRVVATAETADEGRVSAVCFVRLPGPRKDEKKCGRLQEWAPGFNYTMDQADFAGLFS